MTKCASESCNRTDIKGYEGLCSIHYRRKRRKTHPHIDKIYFNQKFYDGKKQQVLERDNFECQECGMSQQQHIILFNRELAIHHIDGNGYYSGEKNNDMDNLITLCLKCHARIDPASKQGQFKKGSRVNPISGKGGRKKGTVNKLKMGKMHQ